MMGKPMRPACQLISIGELRSALVSYTTYTRNRYLLYAAHG